MYISICICIYRLYHHHVSLLTTWSSNCFQLCTRCRVHKLASAAWCLGRRIGSWSVSWCNVWGLKSWKKKQGWSWSFEAIGKNHEQYSQPCFGKMSSIQNVNVWTSNNKTRWYNYLMLSAYFACLTNETYRYVYIYIHNIIYTCIYIYIDMILYQNISWSSQYCNDQLPIWIHGFSSKNIPPYRVGDALDAGAISRRVIQLSFVLANPIGQGFQRPHRCTFTCCFALI